MESRFRGRLTERAYEFIKGRLIEGVYGPGSRLRVDDLVAELKTSRQPVMDALKRLAGEGLIEIIPQVGCRVVSPDRRELSDFFRLFAAAEALTAEFAAERAGDDDRAELRSVHARIAALTEQSLAPDALASTYRRLNRAFHGAIHAMSRSAMVGATAAGFWDRSDFYIAGAPGGELVFARRVAQAHEEHGAIVRAIESGDGAAAHDAMERHVLAFGRSSQGTAEGECGARVG